METFGGKVLDERDGQAWEAAHPGQRTVLLSDVWLDDARVLLHLEAALTGLSAEGAPPPGVLALAGDFLSPAAARGARAGGAGPRAASYLSEFRRGMESLARVLAKFSRLLVRRRRGLIQCFVGRGAARRMSLWAGELLAGCLCSQQTCPGGWGCKRCRVLMCVRGRTLGGGAGWDGGTRAALPQHP